MKNERIIGLDVVRTISILAVVFGHSFSFFEQADNVPLIGKVTPLFSENMLNLGIFGVELFFVLSGFLIGGILIRTFTNVEDFTFNEVRNFWIRRWFRTLPNYWLILTVSFIVYHVILKWDPFQFNYLKGYLFLQNLRYPNILYAFPEGWSLSVEEWFYLTLPVIMFTAAKIVRPVNKSRFLIGVFVSYLLVFLFIRFFNAFAPLNGRDPDEGIRKVVLFRLDAVMYGVLFAYFNHYKSQILDRIKTRLLITCIVLFNIIFYLCIHYRLVFMVQEDTTVRFLRNAFLYLITPFALSLCLPYAISVKTISSRVLSNSILHISKISYSMYMVHFSLIYRPLFMTLKESSFGKLFVYYILYWAIVVVLSSLMYKYFEQPMMNLRERLGKKNVATGI